MVALVVLEPWLVEQALLGEALSDRWRRRLRAVGADARLLPATSSDAAAHGVAALEGVDRVLDGSALDLPAAALRAAAHRLVVVPERPPPTPSTPPIPALGAPVLPLHPEDAAPADPVPRWRVVGAPPERAHRLGTLLQPDEADAAVPLVPTAGAGPAADAPLDAGPPHAPVAEGPEPVVVAGPRGVRATDLSTLHAVDATVHARAGRALRARVRVHGGPGADVMVAPSVRLGRGVVLWPGVVLLGDTVLGDGVVVRTGCQLTDAEVQAGAELRPYTVVEGARVGEGVVVGPFAHLRPGTVLEAGAKVGNFVETKNARLAAGAKANHLTYLGDCTIGPRANIGAGTITCNYDGARKHRTTVGADTFVGTHTSLVAPLTVGDRALIGAGSVVTGDVPDEALVVARAPQRTTPDKGLEILQRNRLAGGKPPLAVPGPAPADGPHEPSPPATPAPDPSDTP